MIPFFQSMIRQIRFHLRNGMDRLLQGTRDHYSCFLPGKIGLLPSIVLKLFFSGIRVEKDQTAVLKTLPRDAVIVYAIKYKSTFELLFYHTRYRHLGLPYPEIGFEYGIFSWQPLSRVFRILLARADSLFRHFSLPDPYSSGYLRNELLNGRAGLLSLAEKKDFYRRFVKAKIDPLRYLIEIQKTTDRPVYIVPQLMFFSKNPNRSAPGLIDLLFGSEENPGRIRRLLILFRKPGGVFVEISEPVSLQQLIRDNETAPEQVPLQLRRQLLQRVDRHRQSITGPTLKSREELKQSILTGDRLHGFMDHYAKTRNIPIQKVHREADGYIDEIAANYNPAFIKIGAMAARWIFNAMFEGVTVNLEVLNRVKAAAQKGPLIIVPCHKSHIDYLMLSYILHINHMVCPHIAAGRNLSFWPMGPIFRWGGAFFIRRSFGGAVLYSKVFSEYLHTLLKEGFNIEFFIEGGRSRTGKLLMPKIGLLSILLNAYKAGACDDLIFVPIFIGYDRVLEESSYLHEIEGGQKEPENFFQLLKARRFLKKRYGRVYVKFDEPISFKELLSRNDYSLPNMSTKDQNALSRNLGNRMINAIERVSVVTPHALVASALLNCPKTNFSYDQLISQVDVYLSHLYAQQATLADTLLIDHGQALRKAFDTYLARKCIEPVSDRNGSDPGEKLFTVNLNRRMILEYYKNNSISFFVPAAFTALSILDKDAFQFSASDLHAGYAFLQDFFKNEFAYNVERTPEFFVRKNVKTFIDEAILMPHPTLPDTYNLTAAGFRKLKLFAGFLTTYFESYWIVLSFLMRNPKGAVTEPKDRLKKIMARGQRMYKRNEVERKESLSQITFGNALDFFTSHGIKGSENSEKIETYAAAIQRALNHLSS